MQGFFSEEALEQCEELLEATYDYTRCVRPDGSFYGTPGKCRKGKQADKASEEGESSGKNFMRGKDVDLGYLEKEASKWAREANLPDTGGKQYHDYVHVLFHEFMGGTDKIAERAGVKGKSPTVAEEFLVTTLQEDVMTRHRTGKPISRAKIIEHLSILYAMFRGHGQIPAGELDFYRDFGRFADLYEGIKKEPGFKQLTEAAAAIPTIV